MHIMKIDPDRCSGCATCVDVCFRDAIRWGDDESTPILAYPDDCEVCCVCERACPEGALEIVPDWASRHCPPYLSTLER
jgi:NAD-dependent dihydropyrimidine dehydrogenase PreA subunit